jgi:alpha-1,2-mannosyltransferase
MATLAHTLRDGTWLTRERARVAALSVVAITVIVLGFLVVTSSGWVDVLKRPVGTDFSSFYVAGTAVLEGEATDPYDPIEQHGRQKDLFGGDTPFYAWQYPPFFLFLAAALALLPYPLALLVWQGGTLLLYLTMVRAIIGRFASEPLWLLFALGFPAVFVTLGHGQNAFLSAALLGGGLVLLDRRPLIAGVLFGLLAYKPQLGVMIPVILLATGRWRTFAAAAATVAALVGAVTLVLGVDVWQAFLASTAFTRRVLLESGDPGWEKLQTVFAWARLWGAPLNVAYALQGAVTIGIVAALVMLWRSRASFAMKASAFAIASVLGTPFSVDYDMTILAIAVAYLACDGLERGFAPWQKTTVAALWLIPLIARSIAGATFVPVGALTMLAALAFVVWRAVIETRDETATVSDWTRRRAAS